MRFIAQICTLFFPIMALAGLNIPGLVHCSELLRPIASTPMRIGDYAVDYRFGIVQLVSHDPLEDKAVVYNSELNQPMVTLEHFSQRQDFARVGSSRASKIIRARVQDFFSIEQITLYFGLYSVVDRLRSQSSFAFKDYYAKEIRNYFPQRNESAEDTLEYLRNISLRRNETTPKKDLESAFKLILRLGKLTEENLFHTGILSTFAGDRISREGIPRDIDHYARSWIWRITSEFTEDLPQLSLKQLNELRTESDVLWIGKINARHVPPDLLTYIEFDPFWQTIYEIVGATDYLLKPTAEIRNKNFRIVIADQDKIRARRIAEEIRRVAFDGDAASVKIVTN